MQIEITKDQAENLIDFLECEFIDSIRNNEEVDNLEYVCNICEFYKMLKKEVEK